jgi:hypothetical protein
MLSEAGVLLSLDDLLRGHFQTIFNAIEIRGEGGRGRDVYLVTCTIRYYNVQINQF